MQRTIESIKHPKSAFTDLLVLKFQRHIWGITKTHL